jgi:hypothetical protein
MNKVYIVTFEELTGGFEERSHLAVQGAGKMTSQELVESMWGEIDSIEDFGTRYKDNPYYWVAGNEKLVRVIRKQPITNRHLKIVNQYITV